MNILLHKLIIENFKGVKEFMLELDGNSAVIKAQNGVGKTTLYDAFLWLMFDKDSQGLASFDMRPLNKSGQAVKGLVVKVEAELEVDGLIHLYRKEQHEKIVKNQCVGYETLCWIDEVPKKVGEYKKEIAELIPEETFKLLTDLSYFNAKFHWKQRRDILLEIAGDVGTPKGFDELIGRLKGRKYDDYKKVVRDEKARYEKERDEINPRIDEILKGIEQPVDIDLEALGKQRDVLNSNLMKLGNDRVKLLASEKQRQVTIEKINSLHKQVYQREAQLANDTSGIQKFMDEKKKIQREVSDHAESVEMVKSQIETKKAQLQIKENILSQFQASLVSIRNEYNNLSETKDVTVCYACGQNLPEKEIAEMQTKKNTQLASITERGNKIKTEVDAIRMQMETLKKDLRDLAIGLEGVQKIYKGYVAARDERFMEIDNLIAADVKPDPKQDKEWQALTAEITKLEAGLGQPVSDQLNAIEAKKQEIESELNQINTTLAKSDRLVKDAARVKELEAKEKELSQSITECDRILAEIQNYEMARSSLVEEAVNNRFKHVKFKLFDYLQNGSIELCCIATLKGVTYTDMSTGEKIMCGMDIVNVLSEHYGISVPLFIDHAESLTLPLEAKGQTIQLYAAKGVKELKIEVLTQAVAAKK